MRPGTRPGAALALTAGGLMLLLRYHTPVTRSVDLSTRPATDAPVAAAAPRPTPPANLPVPQRTPGTAPTSVVRTVFVRPPAFGGRGAPGAHPAPTATSGATTAPVQTFTCQTFQAGSFGPVQVRIKVQGQRWLDIVNLQLPHGDSQTDSISAYAGPQLRREAMKAESANIDNVSSATYTTYAYRQSLQSCIDQW